MILRKTVNGLLLALLLAWGLGLSPANGKPGQKPPPQQAENDNRQPPAQPQPGKGPAPPPPGAYGPYAPYGVPTGPAPPPPGAYGPYAPYGVPTNPAGIKGNTQQKKQQQKECRIKNKCPVDPATACSACPAR